MNATRTNIGWGGVIKLTRNHKNCNKRKRIIKSRGGRYRDITKCQAQHQGRTKNQYKSGWRNQATTIERDEKPYKLGWRDQVNTQPREL